MSRFSYEDDQQELPFGYIYGADSYALNLWGRHSHDLQQLYDA